MNPAPVDTGLCDGCDEVKPIAATPWGRSQICRACAEGEVEIQREQVVHLERIADAARPALDALKQATWLLSRSVGIDPARGAVLDKARAASKTLAAALNQEAPDAHD